MDQFLACVSEFIQLPTIAGQADAHTRMEQAHGLIRKWFPHLMNKTTLEEIGDGWLLKLAGRTHQAPNLFIGHMDVVPASGTWSFPPFCGEIRGDEMLGRGTLDMKGALIALLHALNDALGAGWVPQAPVHLWISCDEEIGGTTTERAAQLLAARGVRYHSVIDEGGTYCEDWCGLHTGIGAGVSIAEKGSIVLELTAHSGGGHAADPPENSPIARLSALVNELETCPPFRRELSDSHRRMLRCAAACLTGDERSCCLSAAEDAMPNDKLKALFPGYKPMLGTTLAFTMMRGGEAPNIIPGACTITCNLRIGMLEPADEAIAKVTNAARRHDVSVTLLSECDAVCESAVKDAYNKVSAMIHACHPGMQIIPGVLNGGTDSKHFADFTDEIVRFTPILITKAQGSGIHGPDERIGVDTLASAREAYRILLKLM